MNEHGNMEKTHKISIRPLQESDLPAVDRIFRLAFGTFFQIPDPAKFRGDVDYVRTRWLADPDAVFVAESDGEIVGSNFATNWCSVGFFGPTTVRPDFWNKGIGSRLMEPVIELFDRWGIRHAGLFTMASSPLHIHLYQKFGFFPRFLTAIMSKPVGKAHTAQWSRYSEVSKKEQGDCLSACRELTNTIYEGLDLKREILAVETQRLGDTILLKKDGELTGFAVCHYGAGTEADNGACYVKFGMVRCGQNAGQVFDHLLNACELLAKAEGIERIVAGVNMENHEAYRNMLAIGFRADSIGVAMHKPNEPGYNKHDMYVINDWR